MGCAMKIRNAQPPPDLPRLLANDETAWQSFFACYDREIRAIAAWQKWRFDENTREEVVQATRTSLAASLAQLRSPGALGAFVRRTCMHRCVDALRRRLRAQERLVPLGHWNEDGDWQDLDIADDGAFDPAASLQRLERAAGLRDALGRMDEPCRIVIHAFYVENRSYREMADAQGIAVNTVGSRLVRCLEKLRERLCRRRDADAFILPEEKTAGRRQKEWRQSGAALP